MSKPLDLLKKIRYCFEKIEIIDIMTNDVIVETDNYNMAFGIIENDIFFYSKYDGRSKTLYVSKWDMNIFQCKPLEVKEVEIKYYWDRGKV